jgi:probable rRNA maturation factor
MERARRMVEGAGPVDGLLEVVLTDDAYVHDLNRRYRDKDRPTDVLSFSYLENHETERARLLRGECLAREFSDDPGEGEVLVGQVLISEPSLRARELRRDHTDDEEFVFLVAHGLLHTLGYDHGDAQQALEMEAEQEALLGPWINGPDGAARGETAS